jgi:hypothetical protein
MKKGKDLSKRLKELRGWNINWKVYTDNCKYILGIDPYDIKPGICYIVKNKASK